MTSHLELVDLIGHFGESQQALDLGSEREQPPRDMNVAQRLDTEMIPHTNKRLLLSVPNRESEVSEEMLGAPRPPPFVGTEDEICVRHLVCRSMIKTQRPDQLGSIVDANVGGKNQVAVANHDGLMFP
jgi:hypothetical protein